MKVILFCGGLGTRLRDYSDSIPKPLVNIGYRPILSVQTVGEAYVWPEVGHWKRHRRRELEEFVSRYKQEPATSPIAKLWARIVVASATLGFERS